jgi:hypothetical protein
MIVEQIQPVQVVTIKSKTPLFKGEEQANAIEKIEIEENGFSLVAQKDLYEIGDKAVYIQPDYSLSDVPLFESFIRPFGDPKKSKLGSNYRIRAVKFNLHTGDESPTYSVGILLPIEEVVEYIHKTSTTPIGIVRDGFYHPSPNEYYKWLTKELGITKWEEPDILDNHGMKVSSGKPLPSGVYKTDETNVNNLWGHIEKKIGYPIYLIGSKKIDGSSISLIIDNGKVTVGSRTYVKDEMISKVVGIRELTLLGKIKQFFGFKVDVLIRKMIENDDQFIVLAKPYINKIKEKLHDDNFPQKFILRGEANGKSWKGSGNKNNPDSKNEPNIKFYGMDDYSSGVAVKMSDLEFYTYMDQFGFERCPVIFSKPFNSKEEIEKECKDYFKTNMIEGIVLRTLDSTFSAKLMNDEYDSRK